MKKKILLIDMDHVMADITQQYIKWYKKATGTEIKRSDLLGKNEDKAFPQANLITEFLHTPGFFRSAPIIPGSQQVIEELNELFEIDIVSAAMKFPQSFIEKYEWLQEHFPFIGLHQIIFCGSKKRISGDFMIDDNLKNLCQFKGERLLFTAAHNFNIHRSGYIRVNNWAEVRQWLMKRIAISLEQQPALQF
jgi:5'-nucleotidase